MKKYCVFCIYFRKINLKLYRELKGNLYVISNECYEYIFKIFIKININRYFIEMEKLIICLFVCEVKNFNVFNKRVL